MSSADQVMVVLSTMNDEAKATAIAENLVQEKLAACVNIVPKIKSIYAWQGKVQKDAEVLMVIKTVAAKFEGLRLALADQHPYDTPEIIGWQIAEGDPAYLGWVREII